MSYSQLVNKNITKVFLSLSSIRKGTSRRMLFTNKFAEEMALFVFCKHSSSSE